MALGERGAPGGARRRPRRLVDARRAPLHARRTSTGGVQAADDSARRCMRPACRTRSVSRGGRSWKRGVSAAHRAGCIGTGAPSSHHGPANLHDAAHRGVRGQRAGERVFLRLLLDERGEGALLSEGRASAGRTFGLPRPAAAPCRDRGWRGRLEPEQRVVRRAAVHVGLCSFRAAHWCDQRRQASDV